MVPPLVNNFTPAARRHGELDARELINQTGSSAGAGPGLVAKPTGPSPYLAQFVRSNYKQTGGPSLNDSLDKLKVEFMQGYDQVMQESDAAYRLDQSRLKSGAAKARA